MKIPMLLPVAALAVACFTLHATHVAAQDAAAAKLEFPQPSPAGKLEQRVGLTDIRLEYSRPSAKGRKIFGGLEPYGSVWRTGANKSTTITFSTPVKFGGVDVAAGSYSLFSIPGEKEWSVMLNSVPEQFGAYGYDASKDVASVKVKPTSLAELVETLTFDIGDLHMDSASLSFAWEKTRVAVRIETDVVKTLVPRIEAAMNAPGEAKDKPYFPAAMFYFENGQDLKKASAWIAEAVKLQPDAFWISYRQGLILAKAGDHAGARAAATRSLELANRQQGSIKDEYVRLNEALLKTLK